MAKVTAYLRKRKTALNTLASLEAFKDTFEERDQFEIPVRLQLIDQCKVDFDEIMNKLEEVEESRADDEQHVQERANFDKRYCTVKGFLLHKSVKESAPSANSTFNTTTGNGSFSGPAQLRLPKIELPTFDGDVTKWLTFKDRFMSMVHGSSEIPAVLKLQYLLSSLVGEAAAHFEHTEITADNYSVTWSTLLKRYDDKKALIREYYRALYFLPRMKSDGPDDLSHLVDEFTRHVKGLRKLGEPVDHWDTPLTNLLFLKLDKASILAWEETGEERDDYGRLVQFLEGRVRMLNSSIHLEVPAHQNEAIKVAGESILKLKRKPVNNLSATVRERPDSSIPKMIPCVLCSNGHVLFNCPKFEAMSVAERYNVVVQSKVCFNCLHPAHMVINCRSRQVCRECRKHHHTMLCRNKPTISDRTPTTTAATCQSTTRALPKKSNIPKKSNDAGNISQRYIFLSTIQLWIDDRNGIKVSARGLLDSGSQTNFMSERLAQQLGLRRMAVDIPIRGIGATEARVKHRVAAKLMSCYDPFEIVVTFLVIKKPTADLPAINVDVSNWNIPETICLADPSFNKLGRIDFILGAEVFFDLILDGKASIAPNLPALINTRFGWVVSGTYEQASPSEIVVCAATLPREEESMDSIMEAFFRVEELNEKEFYNQEEEECEESFKTTTTRDTEGRYVVRLPLKERPENALGDSKATALRRFYAVERRLDREPKVREAYRAFMTEYETLGHMTRVNELPAENDNVYYMPHHPVFKADSTTTKCRVVFDASCKTTSGKSLNDILKIGPTIQEDSPSILMRFRTYAIALVADIEKMYRQVRVHEDDRNLQRILWRETTQEQLQTFRLNTVTYGTASAPFLAIRALKQAADDYRLEFPLAASHVKDFYVDDLISGERDESTALELRQQMEELYARAGFPLRKWASNSPTILTNVQPEMLAVPIGHESSESSVSTLGIIWEPRSDMLRIKVTAKNSEDRYTMRKVLICSARIYDPLGLIDPVKAKAKQFLQQTWALRKDDGSRWNWDDELPMELQREWVQFYEKLPSLESLKISRLVILPKSHDIQIHMFCDASEKGYGACCYVRTEDEIGNILVNLLTSKSKVAPLSVKHSIARLELCAAHLSSKLYKTVIASIAVTERVFFWTDSTTVLHWLNASPSTWKTFVANRVSKIQQATKNGEWRHVPGTDNPADLVSRGMNPDAIENEKQWWRGPSWLSLTKEHWPQVDVVNCGDNTERKALSTNVSSVVTLEVYSPSCAAFWRFVGSSGAIIQTSSSTCDGNIGYDFRGFVNPVGGNRIMSEFKTTDRSNR